MGVRLEFTRIPRKLDKICKSDKVGLYMAQQAERLMAPYVPMHTGALVDDTTVEPFKVTYNSNYAHYVYEGINLNFSKEKHPLATSKWDIAMKTAKAGQLATEVTNFIKKNGY